jgi:hypothetical protein
MIVVPAPTSRSAGRCRTASSRSTNRCRLDRIERGDALSTTPTTFRQFCEAVVRPALLA